MRTVEIGYCPEPMDWRVGEISITTYRNLAETIAAVQSDEGVEGSWIYAPAGRRRDIASGGIIEAPYKSRIFGLPKTHRLSHSKGTNDEHLRFLVWTLGFFMGMRLTDTDAGFTDATPIKPGVFHDIVWLGRSVERAVERSEEFWHRHTAKPRIAKAIAGVIHCFFLSQSPLLLEFEQFIYLYTALDGCHFAQSSIEGRNSRGGKHSERIEKLCKTFNMNVPSWARQVADARNDTLHEALFFDEPLGFRLCGGSGQAAHEGYHVLHQMTLLVSRLLVGILGLPASDYIRSPVKTRQRQGVCL